MKYRFWDKMKSLKVSAKWAARRISPSEDFHWGMVRVCQMRLSPLLTLRLGLELGETKHPEPHYESRCKGKEYVTKTVLTQAVFNAGQGWDSGAKAQPTPRSGDGQNLELRCERGCQGAAKGRDDQLTSGLLRAGLGICKVLLFGHAPCSPCPHTSDPYQKLKEQDKLGMMDSSMARHLFKGRSRTSQLFSSCRTSKGMRKRNWQLHVEGNSFLLSVYEALIFHSLLPQQDCVLTAFAILHQQEGCSVSVRRLRHLCTLPMGPFCAVPVGQEAREPLCWSREMLSG